MMELGMMESYLAEARALLLELLDERRYSEKVLGNSGYSKQDQNDLIRRIDAASATIMEQTKPGSEGKRPGSISSAGTQDNIIKEVALSPVVPYYSAASPHQSLSSFQFAGPSSKISSKDSKPKRRPPPLALRPNTSDDRALTPSTQIRRRSSRLLSSAGLTPVAEIPLTPTEAITASRSKSTPSLFSPQRFSIKQLLSPTKGRNMDLPTFSSTGKRELGCELCPRHEHPDEHVYKLACNHLMCRKHVVALQLESTKGPIHQRLRICCAYRGVSREIQWHAMCDLPVEVITGKFSGRIPHDWLDEDGFIRLPHDYLETRGQSHEEEAKALAAEYGTLASATHECRKRNVASTSQTTSAQERQLPHLSVRVAAEDLPKPLHSHPVDQDSGYSSAESPLSETPTSPKAIQHSSKAQTTPCIGDLSHTLEAGCLRQPLKSHPIDQDSGYFGPKSPNSESATTLATLESSDHTSIAPTTSGFPSIVEALSEALIYDDFRALQQRQVHSRDEHSRFCEEQTKTLAHFYSNKEAELSATYEQRKRAITNEYDKRISLLDDKHCQEEVDLQSEQAEEKLKSMFALKQMEAYCDTDQGHNGRLVTPWNLASLEQQRRVCANLERTQKARIKVLRDQQEKKIEALFASRVSELEALERKYEHDIRLLSQQRAGHEALLEDEFARRKAQLE